MTDVARPIPTSETVEDGANGSAEIVDDIDFVPTTEFGRRLQELRRQATAEGQPLLTREEVEREVAERRGGVYGRDES